MALIIAGVTPGSPAHRQGIQPGDVLAAINGEEVLDQIDYQFLSAQETLSLSLRRPDGTDYQLHLRKAEEESLGLTLDSDLMSHPKQCANNCVFCFVSQLPPGLRPSLYVKDDDWRLSLICGNFVTLTNLPQREIQRIIARRASPLYISVHTTDPDLRMSMMHQPRAGYLMDLLRRFAAAGIAYHCQVVLCPGINDGPALERTLHDLAALHPAARSVALVPVGLTRHRQGLAELTPFTRETAQDVLNALDRWQGIMLAHAGTRFVYAADELYLKAGIPIPDYEAYEDFAQIENGVGLLRQTEDDFIAAARLLSDEIPRPRRVLIATGVSAAPFLQRLIAAHPLPGVQVTVQAIVNHFFGESVTVAGLVTGHDLMAQLQGAQADEILLPASMLRTGEDIFLDGTPLGAITQALRIPVRVVQPDGAALFEALLGTEA